MKLSKNRLNSLENEWYLNSVIFALNRRRKNGTAVEELADLRERYVLEDGGARFRLKVRSSEDDFGNYSCALGGAAPAQAWELRGRPFAKLAANTNVVEGQKLKLLCKVRGAQRLIGTTVLSQIPTLYYVSLLFIHIIIPLSLCFRSVAHTK